MKNKKPKTSHPAWEYRIEYRRGGNDLFEELQNDMGPKGWELCGVVGSPPSDDLSSNWPAVIRYYFKRPVQNSADQPHPREKTL